MSLLHFREALLCLNDQGGLPERHAIYIETRKTSEVNQAKRNRESTQQHKVWRPEEDNLLCSESTRDRVESLLPSCCALVPHATAGLLCGHQGKTVYDFCSCDQELSATCLFCIA